MDEGQATPAHLLELVPTWRVWRAFSLRSTGFPVSMLEPLHAPAVGRAAADYLAGLSAVEPARKEAIGACERLRESADDRTRREVRRTLKKLKAELPHLDDADQGLVDLTGVRAAAAAAEAARGRLATAFDASNLQVARALREIAQVQRFREAILWQTPSALVGIDSWIRTPADARDRKTRQLEVLVARYVQRLCVKNDSVGFFGPVGWGTIDPAGPPIVAIPGATVEEPVTAYLETWVVQSVANAVCARPGVKPWIPPRLSPLLRVDGRVLHTPFGPVEVPEFEASVLSACDGVNTAEAIASRFEHRGVDRAKTLAAIAELEKNGNLRWAIDIPLFGFHQEQYLLEHLARVGDDRLREHLERTVGELLTARRALEEASGTPRFGAALRAVAETFTKITDQGATRAASPTGRSLYRPCARRNVELCIGPDLTRRIARGLAPLLTACRWYSYHMANAVLGEARARFAALTGGQSSASLPLFRFWPVVAAMFPRAAQQASSAPAPTAITEVISGYQARWQSVLALSDHAATRVQRSSTELSPRVQEAFAAPHPGWPSARHHSPDIMIAARDVDAIALGDCLLVVGELHPFWNTLEQSPFRRTIPDFSAFKSWLEQDLPSGRITPAAAPDGIGSSTDHERDMALEHDESFKSCRPRSKVVSIAELVVSERYGELAVHTHDGRRCWSLPAALDMLLVQSLNVDILAPSPHWPRIVIDDLVVQRETWRLSAEQLAFTAEKTPFGRYAAAVRWASSLGLPRQIFCKPVGERRPFYVDFESPVLVENLAKFLVDATAATFSEALPTPEQSWLSDAKGQRYTSELRMVFVDDVPYAMRPWER